MRQAKLRFTLQNLSCGEEKHHQDLQNEVGISGNHKAGQAKADKKMTHLRSVRETSIRRLEACLDTLASGVGI